MTEPNFNGVKEKFLSVEHRKMLGEGSGIGAEIIEARGYWTAETEEDLRNTPGIKPNQYHAPALVIPVHDLNGDYRYSRVRPDNPPDPNVKYLQPSDTPNILDVPLPALGKVLNPAPLLTIIEGEKKADYLASRGIAVVCIFGVWNWSRKLNEHTPHETQQLLPDFDRIPLVGRKVSILFDGDIHTNDHVKLAAYRLATKLKEKGAILW